LKELAMGLSQKDKESNEDDNLQQILDMGYNEPIRAMIKPETMHFKAVCSVNALVQNTS
jgi:hypothetical protein